MFIRWVTNGALSIKKYNIDDGMSNGFGTAIGKRIGRGNRSTDSTINSA
jgi:hypothetical protein